MINVESLQLSSLRVSSSAIASSKACLARWQAWSGWMSRSKVGLSDLSGGLVCFKRLVGGLLSLLGSGEFGKVTVIITLHLVIEDLGLASLSRGDQVLVENVEDIFADLAELLLDCLTVFFDELDLRLIAFGFLLLFDGCDDSPGGTTSTDDVLVGNGEEISLFNRELLVCRSHNLHVLDHFFIALGLLSKLCEVN